MDDDIAELIEGPVDVLARCLVARVAGAGRAEVAQLVAAALQGLGERRARFGIALDVLLRLADRVGPHDAIHRATASVHLALHDTEAAARCLERLDREPAENQAWVLTDAAALVGAQEPETASGWLTRAAELIRRTDDAHPAVGAMTGSARRLAQALVDRDPPSGSHALARQASLSARIWSERSGDRCEIARAEAVSSSACRIAGEPIGALAHAQASRALCTLNQLPPEVCVAAAEALARAHWAVRATVPFEEAYTWGLCCAGAIDAPRARARALARMAAVAELARGSG